MKAFPPALIERLAGAQSVAVLTGAGISAESGVPTFRDAGGLWEQFRPEELANVQAFLRNPDLVQRWYAYRRKLVREVEPNAGHYALVALERLIPDFTLITQNVDNLHRRAGSQRIVELHGNLLRSYCISCRRSATEIDLEAAAEGQPARCPACGGLIRPDVVWFGEFLPEEALTEAYAACERAEVFLSIGTSALVYPAAGLPLEAKRHGAYVAEINLHPSAIAREVDALILGKAGEILPVLVETLRQVRLRNAPAAGS